MTSRRYACNADCAHEEGYCDAERLEALQHELDAKAPRMSVLQPWVEELTLMQQGVLMASIRGPDTIEKNHVAKLLIRWLRRCTLHMAFESKAAGKPVAYSNPAELGGGSFTGPSVPRQDIVDRKGWESLTKERRTEFALIQMNPVVHEYFHHTDEIPHHFHLHLMHAAEVLGYKHPDERIRSWWLWLYKRFVNDMHLNPETEGQMDIRLGDSERSWRAAEEVTAKGPEQK